MNPLSWHLRRRDNAWVVGDTGGEPPVPVPATLRAALNDLDVDTCWVVPGLIDEHRHVPHPHEPALADYLIAQRPLHMADLHAAGVTGVIDMGATPVTPWPDRPIGVRTALCGIEGPSAWPRPALAIMATRAEDASGLVDVLAEQGADLLKIFGTATGRLPRADALTATIDFDVLRALVRRGKQLGLPAAVHCHGGQALAPCLDAGVESIEHGLYLTRADLREMAGARMRLVITPLVYLRRHGEPMRVRIRELVEDAASAGVVVRVGTDSERWLIHDEIEALVDLGIAPAAALGMALPSTEDAALDEIAVTHGLVFSAVDPMVAPGVLRTPLAVMTPTSASTGSQLFKGPASR